MLPKKLLDLLACPICKKPIEEIGDELVCRNCKKGFPVKEGIPVLLTEKARDISS
ncbi:MAG TPA: Trm112 family protein [Candidatus Omnitrophota bacterium]|nr:Trm112 family protein [Candidatus Omnitrophota bacterium]